MTKSDFFNLIKKECVDEKEYLLELLKLRGFLLEENADEIVLSDNSHKADGLYLDKLLVKYGFGCVKNNVVILKEKINVSAFEEEFAENKVIVGESCTVNTDWKWFRHCEHGEKVPVELLEPFIARYVKAISACCVFTAGCCDGNHPRKNKMFLQLTGSGSSTWHRLICQYVLGDEFDIAWINDYTAISISLDTKYWMYYELNRAAELLYNKRIRIRGVKNKVLREKTVKYFRKNSSKDIEKEFIEQAKELLVEI